MKVHSELINDTKRPGLNLHWVCSELNHYHAYFFNELARDHDVTLVVHSFTSSNASHPWRKVPHMTFPHRGVRGLFGLDPYLFRASLDPSNKFVIAGWHKILFVSLIVWLSILRRDFLLWSDTINVSRKRSLPKRLIRAAVTRMVFRAALRVLGTGRPGIEAFAAMGCPKEKLVSFPYFAPLLDHNGDDKIISAEDPVIVVSVGRLDNSTKGWDIGLQALAKVKAAGGRGSFKYVICGTGPDEALLKSQVRELGLSEDVEFMGWLEVDTLYRILQKAHVLLHPARWEPFGVAVLEAMVCGMAVLASDATCAALDRVIDGENGFIHPTGDVDTIAEHLTCLLYDRERLYTMGSAARRTAEQWPATRGVSIIKQSFMG